ncbi:YL1-domain-containing protein, partial [Martensiomyces pterosporus]
SASAKRSRRQNAGNKLQTMIEEERAKIDSGETVASDEDEDFVKKADVDDVVDSDFEETDSEVEHAADDASKQVEAMVERAERRKKRKLARKRMVVPRFASAKSKPEKRKESKESTPVAGSEGTAKRRAKAPEFAVRFSSRSSAVRKALETEALEQEREVVAAIKRSRRKTKHAADEPELTQEQLLEEAKQTEIMNLEKLKEFQEQEAEEKRKQRSAGKRNAPLIIQPIVHWRSAARSDKDTDPQLPRGSPPSALEQKAHTEYSLEKLDESHYPLNPWKKHISVLPPSICPVTGLPARYFHPRAKVPYANARAYKVLEELIRGEHAFYYDIGVWSS